MIKIVEQILKNPILNSKCQTYTVIRLLFSKLDQEIAFYINRRRKQCQKLQRVLQLEQELEEKLASLEDLSKSLPPNDSVQLQNYKVQLQWMLDQIHGQK